MTEKGIIREIKENLVIVIPNMGAACFGCMNQECKDNGGLIKAKNPKNLPLRDGQRVEVRAPGLYLLCQVLAALLPPAFGFMASFSLAPRLFPEAGEGTIAGIGIMTLFATAFLIYRAKKKIPSGKAYTVTKIVF